MDPTGEWNSTVVMSRGLPDRDGTKDRIAYEQICDLDKRNDAE